LTSLVKQIDQRLGTAGKTPRPLGTFVIFVNNSAGLENKLRTLAEKEGLKRVSLCIGAPPKDYEVAQDADITIVIYTVGRRTQQHVTANFSFRRGDLDGARTNAIFKALSDVLPK
jgi:hypothetical protein